MSKVFIDTNIIVYAADKQDKKRSKLARKLLKELDSSNSGVISTQVLQESFLAFTKKLEIEPLRAKQIVERLTSFETVTVQTQTISKAIDISILSRLSFWDALIIAAAESAKCEIVYTEDLNDGQIISGMRVVNPFNT